MARRLDPGGGTRLLLDVVIEAYEQGLSADAIAEAFPVVGRGDIHSAIAYYLNHRDELEAYLDDRRKQAAGIRARIDSDADQAALPAQLSRRRNPRG